MKVSIAQAGLQKVSRRTIQFALLVGSFLFTVNHGVALLQGEMSPHRWFSAALGYAVPLITGVYCPCAQKSLPSNCSSR
jgi:hypothetical protein